MDVTGANSRRGRRIPSGRGRREADRVGEWDAAALHDQADRLVEQREEASAAVAAEPLPWGRGQVVGAPLAGVAGGPAGLGWPEEPHLALWHGATLYREFRGDGHVASLLTDGVGGCEAHVLAAAAGQLPGSLLREYRGWSDEEWAEAAAGLRSRGWLEADGALTEAGRTARDARERRTDDLAMPPWRQLGPDGCARLLDLLDRPVRLVVEGGGIPFPNPVGLPAPSA